MCHDIARARVAADRSAARWREGLPLSAIDGMPLGIKDIIETVDMPTEQGSPLFIGCRTGRDAASVAALREAGANPRQIGDNRVCGDRTARHAYPLGSGAAPRRSLDELFAPSTLSPSKV